MIPFNKPPYTGNEEQYVLAAMRSSKISGDGDFGKLCQGWFEDKIGCAKTLLTPSCTHALEMAALLIDVQPGDEIIMPSFTFVSTANAFALRGATIVFVDIRPDTMNIDERLIEDAITPKTRAIVPVHYAGIACEMDVIMEIADRHNLIVIEDAAQGMMATYKGRPLGGIGHLGTYSFHETKNYTSGGEGGLLIINDDQYINRAEIIREKGTNRSQYFRGQVDKYSWVDIGSSYLLSDLQAAYLWGQLERADDIYSDRLETWDFYYRAISGITESDVIELPTIPAHCGQNAHILYLKVRDLSERTKFLKYLHAVGIYAVFHYVPLHSAPAGKRYGRFHGTDCHTTRESERLLRLPLWYGMDRQTAAYIIDSIQKYFKK